MIFSEKVPFIFIHIPRTGGTSVEEMLSRLLLGKHLPQLDAAEARKHALPERGKSLQHAKLFQYEQRWEVQSADFFTFAFVRNPWALVASEIRYFQKYERQTFTKPTFAENVRLLVEYKGALWGHEFAPQNTYLRNLSGDMAADFVGRFETLQQDFNIVTKRLGLPLARLPIVVNTSRDSVHYTELFDEESHDLVAEHYRDDIQMFNYRFDNIGEADARRES